MPLEWLSFLPERMMSPILVFDTETSGLQSPCVCQLAYVLMESGNVIEHCAMLRLPHGVRMSPMAVSVHGITEAMSRRGGDPVRELVDFVHLCNDVCARGGEIVAHNASFDVRAINHTLVTLELSFDVCRDVRLLCDVRCTMRMSSVHSPLFTKAGRRKPFNNSELYVHLSGAFPTWARLHDALSDVWITAHNFVLGRHRRWW